MSVARAVIVASILLPQLAVAAEPPSTRPSTRPAAATPPPPPPWYPPGTFPPGAAPPGAALAGAIPPGAVPPGVPPPGAMPPGALAGSQPGGFPPGAVPPAAFPPGASPQRREPVMPQEDEPPLADVRQRVDGFRKMYDDGRYAELVEELNARLAAIKRNREQPYPFELSRIHVLRAESHLRLKDQPQAAAALKDAGAFGTPADKARMAATIVLLQRSKQLAYVPRRGPAKGQAIDVVTDRQRALQALFEDELERVRPRVAARMPQTLPQVFQIVEAAEDLRTIELGMAGDVQHTARLLQPVGVQAQQLMTAALAGMDAQAQSIRNRASAGRAVSSREASTFYPAGLTDQDRAALAATIETCPKISRAAAALAPAFLASPEAWRTIDAKAMEIREQAISIRDANYRQRGF